MLAASDPLNAFLERPEAEVPHAASGPLSGLTLAVKDIYDIAGQKTGGGNPHKLAEAPAAVRTAPALQKLLNAGARFIGRTQTDELTFSLMGQNAHYPEPVNPAAPDRVTGGSSSGSAAAVAGGLADIALGSDTGGSIRAPASFCGLIGLRTTHGAITLEGAMPLAPSLDTFGWFARDIETYARVGALLLAGNAEAPASPRLLRMEVLDALLLGQAERDEYQRMLASVRSAMGEPRTVPAPTLPVDDLYWSFRRIQAYEAWAVHGPFLTGGDRQLGPGVKERFEFGATLGCETAAAETKKRQAFREELRALLGDDGFLVLPTVPSAAPLRSASFETIQDYRERALRLLCLSGLSGFPQITLPLGGIDGAPFGISLIGPAGSDLKLIGLAGRIMKRR
ncbi:amidase [Chelativorans sp. ZYF759]|uniref:amidase n=1 Tax=Chelativorans sp. ZYF759 TaxID=2692213 RepID=UPI00145DE858|nr:amidase [Chelativorans sp. ZYF759]NMG40301.1 amidase [Chelativorans sp. ZYF759]